MARWALLLQEFNLTIKHRRRKDHGNADTLSRALVANKEEITTPILSISIVDRVAEKQRKDPQLMELITYLQDLTLPNDSKQAKRIVAEAGQMWLNEPERLFRTWWPQREGMKPDTQRQLVIPPPLRNDVLRSAHDEMMGGHLGIDKTFQRIQEHYWWLVMWQDTKKWISTCESCQARNDPKQRKGGKLEPIMVDKIWERVGMDLVGPLPKTLRGNRYLLTMTDFFSGWVEACAIPEDTTEEVAHAFVEVWICRYGAPGRINSNRGKQFVGRLMGKVTKQLGVSRNATTSYHAAGNGKDENFNKTWGLMTSKFVSEKQTDWDVYIPYLLWAYCTSVHGSTGNSPYSVIFGQEPYSPFDISMGVDMNEKESQFDFVRRLKEARELARKNRLRGSKRSTLMQGEGRSSS